MSILIQLPIKPHHCKFCDATFTISGELVQRLIEGQSGLPGAIKARVDSEKKQADLASAFGFDEDDEDE